MTTAALLVLAVGMAAGTLTAPHVARALTRLRDQPRHAREGHRD